MIIFFREPLELIKNFKDELNFIRKDILNLENNIKNNHDYFKNSVIDIQFQKTKWNCWKS
ncbi:hypothetical protein [Spiroplasma citri]|uniref:hypothetical protein n=1 Tax=Spiroplasma citri TaxID=2133 RepID=UPI0011BBEBFE|nr:hypothetical protein [Spiroplasma citri]QED24652.1 hypothetical protein FRX96_04215 [Spiroplasma citri]